MDEDPLAGIDLDGMMQQMFGAMNPDGSGGADAANNPFAQLLQGMASQEQAPFDAEKMKEAQKMFEDCLTSIEKETKEYHQQENTQTEATNESSSTQKQKSEPKKQNEIKEK